MTHVVHDNARTPIQLQNYEEPGHFELPYAKKLQKLLICCNFTNLPFNACIHMAQSKGTAASATPQCR